MIRIKDYYEPSIDGNSGIILYAIKNTKFKNILMTDGYYIRSGNKCVVKEIEKAEDLPHSFNTLKIPFTSFIEVTSKNNISVTYKTENGNVTITKNHILPVELVDNVGEYIIITYTDINDVNLVFDKARAFNIIFGDICDNKFSRKWDKLYDLLIEANYNPLEDTDIVETKTGGNDDTITKNSITTEDGTVGTNQTITTNSTDNSDIYGFNSTSPIPTDVNTNETTETTIGSPQDNTTHNTQTVNGSDKKINIFNESKTSKGRYDKASTLIMEEISLREKENFFNIIYKDIDSVVTLQIYEY